MTAILWTALCASAWAAPAGHGPDAARFDLAGWEVDDGLPQASVTDVDQGPDGYLLAATFGGLAQFDGARFTVLDPSTVPGLPSARITAVAAAPDRSVWVGTQFGRIARIHDGRAEPAPGDVPPSLGVVWDLRWGADGLWAATEAGLLHLDHGTWKVWTDVGPVTSLATTDGAVWAAGRNGVIRVAGGAARRMELPVPTSALALAAEPGADRVWAMTSAGLVAFEGDASRLVAPASDVAGIAHPAEASILVDGAGRLWVGTVDALVLAGDASDLAGGAALAPTRWEVGSFVQDLMVDRDGTVWAGTGDQGLLRITRNPFERYAVRDGLPFPSAQVVEAGGPEVLVAAGCSPVMALRGDRFVPAGLGEGGCVRALFRDPAGGVWIGEDDRLIPPAGSGIAPIDMPGRVLAIGRDPAGLLWIGTEGLGAWVLRDGAPVRVRGVPDGPVTTFAAAPDGSWWMGLESGVAVARGTDVTLLTAGLPGAQVRSILFDPDGTAWLGTYGGGLVRVRGGESRPITTANGLPENIASVVLDDGAGGLWTNGNRGSYRISRAEAEAVADGRATRLRAVRYPTGEGNGGSSPAGGIARDGRVWLPTLDGVVAFDPREAPVVGAPPVARVEELLLDGVSVPVHDGVVVPPGDRDLSVRFTAAALRDPFLARFEYRLLPSDPDWRDAGESRVVRYPDLAPGRYLFEVRAANEDGVWSDEPARVVFELEPRWTETVWFQALAFLSVVGGVGAVAYLRARRAELHALELEAEIGQRRRVEAELRVREAHYRRVFEGASDGLLVTGADGRVLDANPAAAKMFGRSIENLRGLDLAELLDAQHGEGITPDSRRFPAQIATARLDGERELTSVVDLGPVVTLRERLEQAERLEAIGRLAGGVAHDFNNLLMVIRANASDLLDRLKDQEALHEHVGLIANAADRGAELTQQLLLFGRRQILRPVPLDATALVAKLRPMLRRVLRDNVVLHTEARSAWIHADPAQLELALVHLVLNAADGLPDGGRIALTIAPISAAEADARWPGERPAAPARGWVRISVTDDGQGLPADALPRIFEPFFSADPERAARIGLAGVHGFAAQSMGDLRASSSLGKGSCFDLLLPAAEPQAVTIPPPPAARPSARERVLVCDDDPFVRRSVERLVQSGGYTVLGAGSGREALELLAREGAEILVTDVLMPEMNGAELARRARDARPDLPILFMSGYTRDVLPTELEGELLNKPFTRDGLLAAVRRALASRPPSDMDSVH